MTAWVRGHTAEGVFVVQPHRCVGWKHCPIRRQIQRTQHSARDAFFAALEGRVFRAKPWLHREGSVVGLGHASSVTSTRRAAKSEGKSEPALPQAGNLSVAELPSTNLTSDTSLR